MNGFKKITWTLLITGILVSVLINPKPIAASPYSPEAIYEYDDQRDSGCEAGDTTCRNAAFSIAGIIYLPFILALFGPLLYYTIKDKIEDSKNRPIIEKINQEIYMEIGPSPLPVKLGTEKWERFKKWDKTRKEKLQEKLIQAGIKEYQRYIK